MKQKTWSIFIFHTENRNVKVGDQYHLYVEAKSCIIAPPFKNFNDHIEKVGMSKVEDPKNKFMYKSPFCFSSYHVYYFLPFFLSLLKQ